MMVSVRIQRVVVDSILTYAKVFHPKEGILLLRGRNEKNTIIIDEVVIPPFAVYGTGFSTFPVHMLPADFSIVGTAHSHPSGTLIPSIGDLNNFYGKVMIITGHPYHSAQQIAIFNKDGKIVKYKIIDN
jgi:proteasome lid subunit RPN8/RPN11